MVAGGGADTNVATAFEVPTGHWRNGLYDCFDACCCPCLLGAFCFPILMGQIMQRMKMNFFGYVSYIYTGCIMWCYLCLYCCYAHTVHYSVVYLCRVSFGLSNTLKTIQCATHILCVFFLLFLRMNAYDS